MRSKAPLTLMEQMVMLLVFALAAGLCLQAFVRSNAVSEQGDVRDQAVAAVQSAAEAIRHSGGDVEHALSQAAELLGADYAQGTLTWNYTLDNGRESAPDPHPPILEAWGLESNAPGLAKAAVRVSQGDSPTAVFEIEIAWQEAIVHG